MTDLVRLDTPELESDYSSINVAGEYARQVIDVNDFEFLVEEYEFDRGVEYGEDRVLIEMAASVLNGEHPEVNPNANYSPDTRLNGDDFVRLASELSGSPRTGEEELSELEGTTQVGDKEVDSEQIRAIRNMLLNEQFDEKDEDVYRLRVSFYTFRDGETSIDYIMDRGETMDMEDRIDALEDNRDFGDWP